MDNELRAYTMARRAAVLDFNAALRGLLAGHAEKMEAVRLNLAELDAAFLSALVLTNKGARLDPSGFLAKTICRTLESRASLAKVEKDFLDAHRESTNG